MLKRTRGSVYTGAYHLVFHTKYNRKVLGGVVGNRLTRLIHEIAEKYGFEVNELKVMPNHVHALISVPPQKRIPDVVKLLKGVSSRRLFQEFPQLKKSLRKGHLWAPSYFVRGAGNVTLGTIQRYIREQEKKHRA